jgi:hypothetical protein
MQFHVYYESKQKIEILSTQMAKVLSTIAPN